MTQEFAHKSSAEIEREVQAQRERVDATIGQIKERLSPGQMVDELLNYAKTGGGGEFVTNLGRNVAQNPMPVALMGISLVWLMAKQGAASSVDQPYPAPLRETRPADWDRPRDDDSYGYAVISGDLTYLGPVDDAGARYSEFGDGAGQKFRARSDDAGRRAGHFVSASGETFRGFKNEAGERVDSIRDQAGDMMEDATNWLSDTWNKATDSVRSATDSVLKSGDGLAGRAAATGGALKSQADQATQSLLGIFKDQPLVGGALAFAVGAAIASSLPHTEQEDQLFGEAADSLKQQAGGVVSDAYDKGKEQAAELYETATDKAAEVYRHATGEAGRDSGAFSSAQG